MKKNAFKRSSYLLPLLAAIAGIALLISDPRFMQSLRNTVFDQYQRWHPRDYQAVPVRVIDIDEESLVRLGQWPWPRTLLAEMVDKLNTIGVAAIGFDVVFAEADRTSPRAVAELWSLKGLLRSELEKLPDHDAVFAESIRQAPVVVGFTLERGQQLKTGAALASTAAPNLPARPFRYINSGEPPLRWLHPFDAAITSLPAFEQAAQGNGALSFVPDGDGVVRRVPMVMKVADEPVSTLVTETLRVGQGAKNIFLKAAEEKDTGLAEIRVGEFTVPTTANGDMWVHYSDTVPNRYVPAWKVLAGQVPPELLESHLVLVGASAQGLMDLRFSPLGRIMPGVEAHAQALEQILSGYFLQRPSWATAAEAIAILTGCLLIGFLALQTSALVAAVTSAGLIAVVLGGGWYAFTEHALLLNTVTPALMLVLTFVVGSLFHHFMSEREQRWIKEAFSRYVSPNRVSHLVDNPDDMSLGGKRQECSFIFTDLAGFTSLMESIDPGEAVALLNAYLDEMIGIAFRHEGTLDRIVGDAVAIMFSAPVPQADHRARAFACAMEMDAFATRYAAEIQAKGIKFGKTRIGIHSGEVIVGNFGGSTIFDYRALGDPVNTAARLESVNKHLGTTVCLSEATLSGCPEGTLVRPVGKLVLKGKSQALQVYEPITPERAAQYAPLDVYRAVYQKMAADQRPDTSPDDIIALSPALSVIRELAANYPEDPLLKLHLKRLLGGAHGDLIVMSEK
jgi:adenylate cyclase